MNGNHSHAKPQRRKDTEIPCFAALRLCVMLLFLACFPVSNAWAQAGRIYTAPDPAATGGITGRVSQELTHAVAVERDRVRVFLGHLTDGGRTFSFEHLPVGKYDLVFICKTGFVYEGFDLGGPAAISETSAKNLDKRIALADGFFNHARVHRTGLSPDGETLLAFVERYRANNVLKQSGEALGQMVRRFELIELARATDDWQMTSTRHFYREGEPIPAQPQVRKTRYLPALGNLRVISTLNNLGEITLSN